MNRVKRGGGRGRGGIGGGGGGSEECKGSCHLVFSSFSQLFFNISQDEGRYLNDNQNNSLNHINAVNARNKSPRTKITKITHNLIHNTHDN